MSSAPTSPSGALASGHTGDAVQHPNVASQSDQPRNSAIFSRILINALALSAAVVLLLALVALLVSGPFGLLSAVVTWAVIALFFGISLGVVILAGERAQRSAVAFLALTYAIKVVLFGVFLWLVPLPDWAQRFWMLWGAVATVVVWQIAEILTFSRYRFLIYESAPDVELGQKVKSRG